jgi:hypothetical protein
VAAERSFGAVCTSATDVATKGDTGLTSPWKPARRGPPPTQKGGGRVSPPKKKPALTEHRERSPSPPPPPPRVAVMSMQLFEEPQVRELSDWWKHQRECVKATTETATAQLPAPWS